MKKTTTMKRAGLATGAVLLLSGILAGCSSTYTDPSMIALRYAGGLTEGGEFKECVEPGTKQVGNDTYYMYPTTQRQNVWDSTNDAADHEDLELASKDGVPVYVRLSTNFGLNTDCKTLRTFHDQIGNTRNAYFTVDGQSNEGWVKTMNYYISPAVIARARDVVADYKMSELWPSTGKIKEIQDSIQGDDPDSEDSLQGEVNKLTEGDEEFYNRLSVKVIEVVPDESYRSQFLERQKAQTAAETADLNKEAQVKQAEANQAVKVAEAKAEAAAKKAEIKAYQLPGMTTKDAVRAYNEAKAIEKNLNPWQPNGAILSNLPETGEK